MDRKDPLSRVGEDRRLSSDDAAPGETLPYKIELWDEARSGVQRVLARIASSVLARAAYEAAVSEHANRRITLRRGARLIADSG
jgi:hypothetical protein